MCQGGSQYGSASASRPMNPSFGMYGSSAKPQVASPAFNQAEQYAGQGFTKMPYQGQQTRGQYGRGMNPWTQGQPPYAPNTTIQGPTGPVDRVTGLPPGGSWNTTPPPPIAQSPLAGQGAGQPSGSVAGQSSPQGIQNLSGQQAPPETGGYTPTNFQDSFGPMNPVGGLQYQPSPYGPSGFSRQPAPDETGGYSPRDQGAQGGDPMQARRGLYTAPSGNESYRGALAGSLPGARLSPGGSEAFNPDASQMMGRMGGMRQDGALTTPADMGGYDPQAQLGRFGGMSGGIQNLSRQPAPDETGGYTPRDAIGGFARPMYQQPMSRQPAPETGGYSSFNKPMYQGPSQAATPSPSNMPQQMSPQQWQTQNAGLLRPQQMMDPGMQQYLQSLMGSR